VCCGVEMDAEEAEAEAAEASNIELPSGHSAIAQVTIIPGTDNQDQAAEPESEATPEPEAE
jgi:hypothetical protein